MSKTGTQVLSATGRIGNGVLLVFSLAASAQLGCSGQGGVSAADSGSATGGSSQPASGGATGSGGRVGGTGGSPGSGGTATVGTGGSPTGSGGSAAGTGGTATGGRVGTGGVVGTGGMVASTGGAGGFAGVTGTCTPMSYDAAAIGFAMVGGTTTGGGNATPTMVSTAAAFNTAAGGTNAAVILFSGSLSGNFTIGSNKTIIGACNAQLSGHVEIDGSTNVIFRNVKVVGRNCTDNSVCESGADAITVQGQADHLWFDHCDVSNGSDGNLDMTDASDYITISWSKFSYSGQRAGGHQFSNLIGADDGDTGDAGHLRTTFHHNWWGPNVGERMPRVRFGQVHIFNNLWTATGNNNCIGVGVSANILAENNFFSGVSDPIEVQFSNAASVLVSRGNIFQLISGSFAGLGTPTAVFTPSYTYLPMLMPATSVQAAVMTGAGVH
jgi:pectate lyase